MDKRSIAQSLSLLALHSSWGPEVKWLCNPVLSCHSCALSWFACPIGVLVHYSSYHLFPLFAAGTILLIGVVFGRLLCGWVCPFGFVQDLLHKIPTRKFKVPEWTANIKYLILIFMVLLLPFFLGELTYFSFCRICPASALQVLMPGLISSGFQTTLYIDFVLAVLIAILLFSVFTSRGFCKVLCPIGALLAPLNHISYWFVRIPGCQCVSCAKCDEACITDVRPSERITRAIPPNRALDCVVCHECQSECRVANRGAQR